MGLAYKENVTDTRESPVSGIVAGFSESVAGRWRDSVNKPLVPCEQVKEK